MTKESVEKKEFDTFLRDTQGPDGPAAMEAAIAEAVAAAGFEPGELEAFRAAQQEDIRAENVTRDKLMHEQLGESPSDDAKSDWLRAWHAEHGVRLVV